MQAWIQSTTSCKAGCWSARGGCPLGTLSAWSTALSVVEKGGGAGGSGTPAALEILWATNPGCSGIDELLDLSVRGLSPDGENVSGAPIRHPARSGPGGGRYWKEKA